MEGRIKEVFAKLNIGAVGVTGAELYNCVMNTDFKSIIVALFPYYCGYAEGSNLSIYTYGADYHKVIAKLLESAAASLGLSGYAIHADTGPEIERTLAANAGLCFKGRNGMCINDTYGSYFFIGYIACREEFEPCAPCLKKCLGCMRCVSACPGGALDGGFCEKRCLSAITQKKGALTLWERELIKDNKYVFGCDICQRVCPHNKNVLPTETEEFKNNLITRLNLSDIEQMSNREFKRRYSDRAFSWRGKAVLERNLKITAENDV